MIKLGDIIEVTIEKAVYGGDGLARFSDDNFVIFVKNALPNEKLKVQITSLNKKFARAKIVEILASKERIKPFCALYNACGSCDNQICSYDYSTEIKTSILKDIFKDIVPPDKIYPIIKSPNDKKYRHKVQFPARQTKKSKRILLGYFKENTHDLTNIKFCPLQDEVINDIMQFIRDNFNLPCYIEKTGTGLLKNVLMRISNENKDILLTLVLNCTQEEFSKYYDNKIFRFFKKITSEFNRIKGGFVNFNPEKSNKILSDETIKVLGEDFIIEKLKDKQYKIGAQSFFQVNPESAVNLFDIVKDNTDENSTILDAYGGVGAIGIYLSEKAKHITLVEENSNATKMAQENFKLNNVQNYEILTGDAKEHFLNFKQKNKKFDCVIVDPPRSGCEKSGLEAICHLTDKIIYVSCNPQTLRRDMFFLIEENFKPEFVRGVDLFPYTHHIESVVLFKRSQNVQ